MSFFKTEEGRKKITSKYGEICEICGNVTLNWTENIPVDGQYLLLCDDCLSERE